MEKQETINGGHIKCRIQTHINGSRYLRATLDIRLMIFELEMKLEGHMKLHCNKKSIISIGHNAIHHDQTKHVEIDQMFIKKIKKKKKKLESGKICSCVASKGSHKMVVEFYISV